MLAEEVLGADEVVGAGVLGALAAGALAGAALGVAVTVADSVIGPFLGFCGVRLRYWTIGGGPAGAGSPGAGGPFGPAGGGGIGGARAALRASA